MRKRERALAEAEEWEEMRPERRWGNRWCRLCAGQRQFGWDVGDWSLCVSHE